MLECFRGVVVRVYSRQKCKEIFDIPASSDNSVIHCSSFCRLLDSLPHEFTHSCLSSSHFFLPILLRCIPFAIAKRSHFVKAFVVRIAFDLGKSTRGEGSTASRPSEDGRVDSKNSESTRTWAPSRAADLKWSSIWEQLSFQSFTIITPVENEYTPVYIGNNRALLFGYSEKANINSNRGVSTFIIRICFTGANPITDTMRSGSALTVHKNGSYEKHP